MLEEDVTQAIDIDVHHSSIDCIVECIHKETKTKVQNEGHRMTGTIQQRISVERDRA